MTPEQNKNAAKLKKLMALANHPGTGAEESAAAAAMAAELAMKYNLDLDATIAGVEKSEKKFERGETAISASGGYRAAMLALSGGLGALYGCRALVWCEYSSKCHISFVGQAHNVAMANTWAAYLWTAAKRADAEYRKTQVYATGAENRRASVTFCLNFAHIISFRLKEKLTQMTAGKSSSGTALMVVNWYEQERKELAAWMDENMKVRKVTNRPRRLDPNAAAAGMEAGKRANLSEQISPSPKTRRIQ